ncbi:phosphate acetyltransferase [Buchnera aphidicola]|uniref:phosphate acetyltransferase n=1 Tax=Buchnera aphidicola TaxID=9 RepID=UPI00094CFA47|nr:phosphate acetyltransferase [Buchnera aphidicola]
MKNYSEEFKLFLQKKACSHIKTIIFPEGSNLKIIKAASICSTLKISKCILLGEKKYIQELSRRNHIDLDNNILIIDPSRIRSKYVRQLIGLRKKKEVLSDHQALQLLYDNVILSLLMLSSGDADGVVAGINRTTADVIRPAFQLLQHNCRDPFVSSVFLMLFSNQILVYGDCAINRYPDSAILAKIAIQSANTATAIGILPKVAMLSYSTGSSGSGKSVDRVREAVKIAKNSCPQLLIDGPMQYDAAISPEIAQIKLPNSDVAGNATVLIFPDLNSGNITYKAVQQASQIISIGPILQGLKKPVNDLSRGASIDDIVYTTAMTVIQSF